MMKKNAKKNFYDAFKFLIFFQSKIKRERERERDYAK